ncbi:Protein C04F6.7 [Aphelenchoides avenae]|nr:Protein C04F6.7 [Aphelenchus avenae]
MSPAETVEWERIPHSRLLHIDDYGGEFQHDQLKRIPEYQTGELNELLKKVRPALEKEFAQYALMDRPRELGIPLLLCHGDAGAHNIFFKAAADGTASNEIGAFIDWQIAFKGNPMHDICRILYPFCDAEVRRDVETTIVEEYYDRLATESRKKGLTVSFNVEKLREAYSLAAVHQTLEMGIRTVHIMEFKKDDFTAEMLDAWRHKLLLRAKLSLRDSIEMLRKYAPQFLAE